MAAEMPEARTAARLDLTVTGGGGDPERNGYWTVTGPQDPNEVHAIIERSRNPDDGRVFFAWYLNQRSVPEYNGTGAHMLTIAEGFQPSLPAALDDLTKSWQGLLGPR